MDLAYYPGCSLSQSAQLYNHQTSLIFKQLGIHLQEITDWNCCGATSVSKINDFMAVALSARNLGIAESSGVGEMVVPCSACYSRTLVAQQRMRDNDVLVDHINEGLAKKVQGKIKVSSILEILERFICNDSFQASFPEKLHGIVPVCYYGCMSTRFPYPVTVADDVENPQGMEKVLRVLGVAAMDWNFKVRCCGASAAIYDPDVALKLMAAIMDDALARKANCIVVTCPMCQMNLDFYQHRFCEKYNIKERLPIYFITELLGLAMGMSPEELLLDRHFIPGDPGLGD
jgi:heterodisulfide reductase subunit B